MNDPYKLLVLHCVDTAAAEYISGRMNMQEAVEYGMQMVDKYAETEEFNNAVEEYYNKFVDIKDLELGDKNVFVEV
jgi:hypothetical protein